MLDKNTFKRLEHYPSFDLIKKMIFEVHKSLENNSDKEVSDFVNIKSCSYGGNKFVLGTHENVMLKSLIESDKFKNVKIDKSLLNLISYTDNAVFDRNLFYPSFFIDSNFEFNNRFVVKGILVYNIWFYESTINHNEVRITEDFNDSTKIDKECIEKDFCPKEDIRVHFYVLDKVISDSSWFCASLKYIFPCKDDLTSNYYLLPGYRLEKEAIETLINNVLRITCNVIDIVEGNKNELDVRVILPSKQQIDKKRERGKSPICTTVIIKPKKELVDYVCSFEREHRKLEYSHKFVVRGHWRHFKDEKYVNVKGKKTWVRPYIKGDGILIRKNALLIDRRILTRDVKE
ncbi:MAG: hypothetical protein PHP08_00830 [Candidatus Dojkabacteria bacterium]|nr:hypothetical protein [Candidatus Dojkabacteria bacterium]